MQFIETNNFLNVKERCDALLLSNLSIELGEITGPAGRGKTTAIKYFVANNPDALMIQFSENLRYGNSLYKEVAYRTTGIIPAKTSDAWTIIENSMAEQRRMLFVDEADRMSARHLNALRDIHDKCNVPVVFVGEEPLVEKINSERRLRDRMSFRYMFKPITMADIIIVFKMAGIVLDSLPKKELTGLLEKINKLAGGTFRPVVSLARECKRVININGLDNVSLEVIKQVCNERK